MKKSFLLLILCVSLFSCEKSGDGFQIEDDPFTVFPSTISQNVLLENFVGEWSDESESTSLLLDSLNKESNYRICPVKFHDGDWLETGYTVYQREFLGGLAGISIGSLNREAAKSTLNNEDGFILMHRTNWAYNAFRLLNQTPPLGIALNTNLNADNTLNVDIYIAQTSSVSESTRLLFYLVEDNIEPIFQNGASDNFKHDFVFKKAYPDQVGIPIDQTAAQNNGTIKKLQFSNIDLSEVNIVNAKIIAFIYKESDDFTKRQVLNVQSCNVGGARIWQ